ncbi:DUF3631 domain-containing protein [Dietzia cinnamea]|uniref:DUF3631 domain-containing protein n=1 Tax=Dietzia cinnamea TaxID=321318 RepID=UPI0021A68A2E|nr:DUF3631 domain-containing protein [Dietzia cinnamea]MCT2031892.1 DUF3631 domain-containing protein [Dietzia cinnamea]
MPWPSLNPSTAPRAISGRPLRVVEHVCVDCVSVSPLPEGRPAMLSTDPLDDRASSGSSGLSGYPAVEPARGAELLDEVAAAVSRYCILPSPHALTGVVLWIAYTHMSDAFEYAPRLVARSAEKRSGKSRLLEVVDALVHEPLRAVNATVSYIFRSLDRDGMPPTLLLDEADTIFGTKTKAEQNEDLRGLLNAGFQRGLTFGRTVGPSHTPTEFQTFAPAALAGIGQMPDTIEDRAVVVVMRRRKPSETVAPYRTRRDRPALEELAHSLAAWASTVTPAATGYEPENLGVEDRAADVWEPLVSVADMAGGRWPALAREAAAFMVSAAEADSEDSSLNIRLLADIKAIFDDESLRFIKSDELCRRLREVEESPWGQFELSPSRLGHRLKEYGIKTDFEDSYKKARGYRLIDFLDAFERYLAPKPSDAVRTRIDGPDLHEQSDALKSSDTFKASEKNKPSEHNPSSEGVRTPSDTFGHDTAPDGVCKVCSQPILLPTGTGICSRRDLEHDFARGA